MKMGVRVSQALAAAAVLSALACADMKNGTFEVRCAKGSKDATPSCEVVGSKAAATPNKTTLCTVATTPSLNTTGWDKITVTARALEHGKMTAHDTYYAMGFGEAYLTYSRIYDYAVNSGLLPQVNLSHNVSSWVRQHMDFMEGLSAKPSGDRYKEQLGQLLAQVAGMADGYQKGCKAAGTACTSAMSAMNKTVFFLLNFQNELDSVRGAYSSHRATEAPVPSRCSALIKVTDADVFFSHATWSSYSQMMRMFKEYKPGNVSVMLSGYPGVVHSADDFYTVGRKLAVMETTNSVYNWSLVGEALRSNTSVVSAFLRVMIANYLAATPDEWAKLFAKYNSGTYNNQWMVLNLGAVKAADLPKLPAGAFVVLETLPGIVNHSDQTATLNKQGYWASYNIPFYANVAEMSGTKAMEAKYGSFFSHSATPRAEIFRRNQSEIKSVTAQNALMQYNDFAHDKLSLVPNCTAANNGKCTPPYSAWLAIASRGDLVTPGGVQEYGDLAPYVGQRAPMGAIDLKTTSYTLLVTNARATVVARSGPTSRGQPVFNWSASPWQKSTTVLHNGLPEAYNFEEQWFVGSAPAEAHKAQIVGFVLAGIGVAVIVGTGFVLLCMQATRKKASVEYDTDDYLRVG